MPLYDWECTEGHIFEQYVSLSNYTKGMVIGCPRCTEGSGCTGEATRVVLTHRQARLARTFQPSVFYERDGELWVGGTNDARDLQGYDKELLKQGYKEIRIENYRQYEQFQRSHSQALKVKQEAEIELRTQLYNSAIQQNIDDIKQGYTWDKPIFDAVGNHIGTEAVQIPPLHRLEPQARALAEYALERMRDTSDIKSLQASDQRTYIDAFENDRPQQEDTKGSKKWF